MPQPLQLPPSKQSHLVEVEVAEDTEDEQEDLDSEAVDAVVVVAEDAVGTLSITTTALSATDTLKSPCVTDVASQGTLCAIARSHLVAGSHKLVAAAEDKEEIKVNLVIGKLSKVLGQPTVMDKV